jgi:BlaI family transcriptional regulator, penicillinase repressor
MARTPRDVTDAELGVMQRLWEQGPATIRQLAEYLHGGACTTAQYATVQKLLDRLETKGCVRRDRGGAAHTFAAAVNRDQLIGRRLQDVAEKLCGGSLTPLLTHLVRSRPLSAAEREQLRTLIDEVDTEPTEGEPEAR